MQHKIHMVIQSNDKHRIITESVNKERRFQHHTTINHQQNLQKGNMLDKVQPGFLPIAVVAAARWWTAEPAPAYCWIHHSAVSWWPVPVLWGSFPLPPGPLSLVPLDIILRFLSNPDENQKSLFWGHMQTVKSQQSIHLSVSTHSEAAIL